MNNKTNSLVTIILAVAVVVLFVLHFTGGDQSTVVTKTDQDIKGTSKVTTAHSDSSVKGNLSGLNIAYVNSDTVTKYYEYNKKLTSELMAKQASAENKLRKEAEKLQADFAKFQQEAPIMGQSELERKQMEFMQREQELGMMEQELAGGLADKSYKANVDYILATDAYLQKIGKTLGYDYIIGYRVGDLIMYADPQYDITDQMVELLNEAYLADQKSE